MIILSHASCMDGLAAAWVCKQAYPDAIVHFLQYGDALPEIPDSESVIMVDFSAPRGHLESLFKQVGGRVVVLDHHKSAKAELEGLPFAHFEMEECGATLAWRYLFPNEPLPLLLEYVKDRDLWLWKQKNSREVSAALSLAPLTIESFDELMKRDIFSLVREGAIVLKYQEKIVDSLAKRATFAYIKEYHVPVVNSPILQSEIGERLLLLHSDAEFAAIFFDLNNEGERVYSLRSRGDFDVSEQARSFGGGGHAAAAGFRVNIFKDKT